MSAPAASAVDSLSDDDYAVAQRVLDVMHQAATVDRRKSWSRSELARRVKHPTVHMDRALIALKMDGNIASTNRGAWSRYTFVWG